MPPSPTVDHGQSSSTRGRKRRRSEAETQLATDAKRRREEEADEPETHPPRHPAENELTKTNHAPDAKEKKKRKKKKKKLPLVQQQLATASENNDRPASNAGPSTSSLPSAPKNDKPTVKQRQRQPSSSQRLVSASPELDDEALQASSSTKVSIDATTPTSNKGKKRARSTSTPANTSPSAAEAELAKHQSLMGSLLPSLTCQICLLLMHRPFALAPCGHVSCYTCLVSWFTNPPAQAPAHNEGEAAQAEAPNANANNVLVFAMPVRSPTPVPLAPIARRKKTCPHCRALVREKPIEVWTIKDMVSTVVRSGLADPESIPTELQQGSKPSATSSATDPWKDIFPEIVAGALGPVPAEWAAVMVRENLGILDEEDGGVYRCVECAHEIWDGICSDCGRVYPGHGLLDDLDGHHDFGAELDSADDGDFDAGGDNDPVDWDEDGGTDSDDAFLAGMFGFLPQPPNPLNIVQRVLQRVVGHDESDEESREEDYESSFIDDGDAGEGSGCDDDDDDHYAGAYIEEAHSEDELRQGSEADEGRSRAGSDDEDRGFADEDEADVLVGWGRPSYTINSGDEDSDVEDDQYEAPVRRGYSVHHGAILSDEDELDGEDEGDDQGLAEAVAAYERQLYGDDGSVQRRRPIIIDDTDSE